MTILYHHRTLLDGAEGIHIREMIRAFEALGHTVAVSSPGSAGGQPGALPRLARRVLPQGLFELAAAAHNLPERRHVRRLIARLRPAFVYARHALNDLSVLQAARETGTPVVLEINVLYSSDALQRFEPLTFRRLTRALEAQALRLAALVIVVSTPLRDLVREIAPGATVVVMPNGANPDEFPPEADGARVRARLGLPADGLVVGWSGVVRAWHRLDLLVEAVALRRDAWLLVVGDGPDRREAEAAARALGIADRVRFAGYVPRDEMAAHVAAMDVGAVADDRTGVASPMKLLEYMAMGKPVLAPDLPNIRDLVTDGREALLFRPGDAASVASCLDRLSAPEVRQTLGARARERVVTERNWMANARVVVEMVRPLVRGSRPEDL